MAGRKCERRERTGMGEERGSPEGNHGSMGRRILEVENKRESLNNYRNRNRGGSRLHGQKRNNGRVETIQEISSLADTPGKKARKEEGIEERVVKKIIDTKGEKTPAGGITITMVLGLKRKPIPILKNKKEKGSWNAS